MHEGSVLASLCLHPHGRGLEGAACCTFVARLNLTFLCPL